jgi:HSP90 family molecular chaperone
VLRELIQNADDAKAKNVFIRFESQDFIDGHESAVFPDLKTSIVSKKTQTKWNNKVTCLTLADTPMDDS